MNKELEVTEADLKVMWEHIDLGDPVGAIKAIVARYIPEGHVVVPDKPTQEWIESFCLVSGCKPDAAVFRIGRVLGTAPKVKQ